MLAGLVVHEPRMRENLDLTQGLIVAEAVMMAAAPKLGRQKAHDVVYDACRKAIEGGGELADILAAMPEIADALGGGMRSGVTAIPRTISACADRWSIAFWANADAGASTGGRFCCIAKPPGTGKTIATFHTAN